MPPYTKRVYLNVIDTTMVRDDGENAAIMVVLLRKDIRDIRVWNAFESVKELLEKERYERQVNK